jgi:hypothetical protein
LRSATAHTTKTATIITTAATTSLITPIYTSDIAFLHAMDAPLTRDKMPLRDAFVSRFPDHLNYLFISVVILDKTDESPSNIRSPSL